MRIIPIAFEIENLQKENNHYLFGIKNYPNADGIWFPDDEMKDKVLIRCYKDEQKSSLYYQQEFISLLKSKNIDIYNITTNSFWINKRYFIGLPLNA